MGRPESADHGSTSNKSKSFQASRRAGTVRKREQEVAGGHATVLRLRTSPAGFIGHRNCPLVVARRCRVQARPKNGRAKQMFGAKRQVLHAGSNLQKGMDQITPGMTYGLALYIMSGVAK